VERQLKLLVELQGLDIEISHLAREKESIPEKIRTLEERYGEGEARLKLMQEVLADLQARRRSKERELEHQSSEMKKRQGRLLEIKTNKEYSAILQEIQVLKDKQSGLEDEILEVLDKIDQQGKEAEGQKEQLTRAQAAWREERTTWEKKLEEVGAHLAELLKERAKRLGDIEPTLIQTYTRIYENRQGLAVVPLTDRSCSGCFVNLTPQTYQETRRNDRIITCANCNRIIYWKEG
jgi:hypothetical protein